MQTLSNEAPARILVIDDHAGHLDLILGLLKMFGFVSLAAAEAESGLETARHEQPDLIVCSIQLPGISGYEFARRIKADPNLGSLPLMAMGAFAVARDRGKALKAGFNTYVSKPIDPDMFLEELAALLPPGQPRTPALTAGPAYFRAWWKA
jgi:CheY-like chemotaxis protein